MGNCKFYCGFIVWIGVLLDENRGYKLETKIFLCFGCINFSIRFCFIYNNTVIKGLYKMSGQSQIATLQV